MNQPPLPSIPPKPKAKPFASGTDVPIEKTRAEIELLLRKHGASQLVTGWDYEQRAGQVVCTMAQRMVRFRIELPPRSTFELDSNGKKRPADHIVSAMAAEERRRWRAMLLVIKAKLEIVATGSSSFEREFLADILLPDGSTVGDVAVKQIADSYKTGGMPKSLLLGSGNG